VFQILTAADTKLIYCEPYIECTKTVNTLRSLQLAFDATKVVSKCFCVKVEMIFFQRQQANSLYWKRKSPLLPQNVISFSTTSECKKIHDGFSSTEKCGYKAKSNKIKSHFEKNNHLSNFWSE